MVNKLVKKKGKEGVYSKKKKYTLYCRCVLEVCDFERKFVPFFYVTNSRNIEK